MGRVDGASDAIEYELAAEMFAGTLELALTRALEVEMLRAIAFIEDVKSPVVMLFCSMAVVLETAWLELA